MVNCSSSTAGVDNTVVHQQTIIPDNDVDNNTEDESLLQFTPFILRLHLIRHGETIANVQNIVLGQGDSPLTDNGLILAQMASESPYINGRMTDDDNNNDNDRNSRYYYWRTYCSDLHRAHRTARIVLCLEDIHGTEIEQLASDDDNSNRRSINLIVEPRLRELAKGAREGYPKSLSYEEAVTRRIQEADDDGSSIDNVEIPLLESIDDAWERAKDWIDSLVNDASIEYNLIDESCDDANSSDGTKEKVYNVFGLSHSALIRTMIHKLPENYSLTKEGSLRIPNLSRTIIDVRPYKVKGSRDDALRWKCRLLHLTDVSHLSDEPSRNFHQGAPYL
jgi:broad specificity phosphatase PhoE